MDATSRFFDVRAGERRQTAWAAAWFAFALGSYYAIRPVREAFGVDAGPSGLRWLYTGTFIATLAVTPLYGWLVRITSRQRIVLVVYGLFVVNLVGFWIGFAVLADEHSQWLRWVFYVWVSVYNLYLTAIFWSAAVELFSSSQAKRLFGLLAGAGTLGSLAGSEATRSIVAATGQPRDAALLSAAMVAVAIWCSQKFRSAAQGSRDYVEDPSAVAEERNVLADAWGGMRDVFQSKYLAGLAVLMVVASVAGTGIYMQLSDFVRTQLTSPVERTDFFARLNNFQNAISFVGQVAAVGWAMQRFGLAVTLLVVPVVYGFGFAAIGMWPTLLVHGVVDVSQRVASFAAGVPSREVLFTVVSPDEKYRAKAFIDTVGKRTGDAVAAHAYAWLRIAGWTAPMIAWASVPLAGIIAVVSVWLAREHKQRATEDKLQTEL